MAGSGIWAKIHKWLALLMAIQILFWFVSGLFFAIFPIERVRSEHAVAVQAPAPIALDAAAAGLARLAAGGVAPGERLELRSLLGRPVALVSGGEARPRLYDLATGRSLSPLPMTTEYRGALPAWRVDFEDGANRSLYVAADTGAVTARRSTLWRVYDFLWGLHIMDWRAHEDFNSPLLIVATALGLVVVVAGIVMFPSRLGLTAWLRRRRAVRLNAERTGSAARPG
jgi:hypothetical protein